MTCGEGVDLAGLRLGPAQYRLLDAVVATGTPTAVVLIQGRPHVVPDTAGALLTAWYPGPWGGEAIAEVLLGRAEPTGRLPVSVPRSAAQLPVYYNHKDTEYGGYVDESAEPHHSFGHGLSYTSFAYGTPRITDGTVTVDVSNTGDRYGRSVVQVYLRRLITSTWPRTLELCAFQGVGLEPGERRTVVLPLSMGEARTDSAEIRVAESARAALRAVPIVLDMRDVRA
jgi:beta-glucosidase